MAVAIQMMVNMLNLRLQLYMVGLYDVTVLPNGGLFGDARQPCLYKLVGYEEQTVAGGCAPLMETSILRYRDILHLWMCKKYG